MSWKSCSSDECSVPEVWRIRRRDCAKSMMTPDTSLCALFACYIESQLRERIWRMFRIEPEEPYTEENQSASDEQALSNASPSSILNDSSASNLAELKSSDFQDGTNIPGSTRDSSTSADPHESGISDTGSEKKSSDYQRPSPQVCHLHFMMSPIGLTSWDSLCPKGLSDPQVFPVGTLQRQGASKQFILHIGLMLEPKAKKIWIFSREARLEYVYRVLSYFQYVMCYLSSNGVGLCADPGLLICLETSNAVNKHIL